MELLKQSTGITPKIGPFLDDTDGKTAETGLTIAQADVRLSKNGANIAQKNEATSCTHDELGVYGCPIDTTDTNTLGRLQLWVHESGALPVWHEYLVVTANTYDALVAGSDVLQADLTQLGGVAQRMTDLAELVQYAIANAATLGDIVADNSILAKVLAIGGDISDFSENSDSLEAIRDRGDAAWITATGFAVAGNAMTLADDAITAAKFDQSTAYPANEAIVTYGLDHLLHTAVADEVVDNSIIAKLAATGGDWSTFAWGTDSLQSIRDVAPHGTAMRGTENAALAASFAFTGTDVKATLDGETVTVGNPNDCKADLAAVALEATVAGLENLSQAQAQTAGEAAIDAKFNFTGATVDANTAGGGDASAANQVTIIAAIAALNDPSAATVTAAVWTDANGVAVRALANHFNTMVVLDGAVYDFTAEALAAASITGGDATQAKQDAIIASLATVQTIGAGASTKTIEVTDTGGNPVADADVWLSTDVSGNIVVAGTRQSDSSGLVTFQVDVGSTYYVWAQKDGVNFTNPTEWEVA